MEPRGTMPHSKGSPIVPILSRINPILPSNNYIKNIF